MRTLLRFSLLAATLALALPSIAMPVTRAWSKSFDLGQSVDDQFVDFQVDPKGNVTTLGFNALGQVGIVMSLTRFDQYGTYLWSAELFLNGPSGVSALAVDGQGNSFVTGYAPDTGSREQILTMKFHDGGALAWYHVLQDQNAPGDYGAAIEINSNGDPEVAGQEIINASDECTGRIAYSNANGAIVAHSFDKWVARATASFSPDGYLMLAGLQSSPPYGNSSAEIQTPLAAAILKATSPNTATKFYGNLLASDSAKHFYHLSTLTDSSGPSAQYVLHILDEQGNEIATTGKFDLQADEVVAYDLDHIFITDEKFNSGLQEITAVDSVGNVKWSVGPGADKMAASDATGVVGMYTTNQEIVVTKYDNTGSVSWTQSYHNPAGISDGVVLRVVNGAVYVGGTTQNASRDLLFLKYAPGVGIKGVGMSPNPITNAGQVTVDVTLNAPAPAGGFPVHMLSNFPSIIGVQPTITIPQGATYAKFKLNTAVVDNDTSVTITGQANGVSRWASTLVSTAKLTQLTLSAPSVKGGTTLTGTIVLNGKTGLAGKFVNLGTDTPAHVVLAPNVKIAAGHTSGVFTIKTTAVASNTNTMVTVSLNGQTLKAALTLTP